MPPCSWWVGVQLPFLPVWLKARGLDASLIGVALALPMVVRVIAVPLATRIADRQRGACGRSLAVAAAASFAGYLLLAFAPDPRRPCWRPSRWWRSSIRL